MAGLKKHLGRIRWWGWVLIALALFIGIGALGSGESDNSSESTPSVAATARQTTTPAASVHCKSPDPVVCQIATDQFGDKLIDAMAIKNQNGSLGIFFDFRQETAGTPLNS